MVTHEQAEKIIALLQSILDRTPTATVVPYMTEEVSRHQPGYPSFPFQPVVLPPAPFVPTYTPIGPSVQPRDCGCPPTTICMNTACPRISRIVVSSTDASQS
jgi:hypothetical protein